MLLEVASTVTADSLPDVTTKWEYLLVQLYMCSYLAIKQTSEVMHINMLPLFS